MAGELVTAAQLNTHIRDNENYLFSALYPVGSIYISTSSTDPASLLGFGTWAAFGAGRTLVGIDAGQTEFDVVEETGGAKTHTLSTAEIPAHTHPYDRTQWTTAGTAGSTEAGNFGSPSTASGSTGGGGAHNNLQPYVVVYMWKRTA